MPTLFELLEEHQSNRRNHKRDKRVFGLVLPGGAMRGAYQAGALRPLIENHLSEAFDHVVGSSAGAINGTYFIDDYDKLMFAYPNDLANKDFVNLLRREKKVDVDYAIDTVVKVKNPFNMRRLRKAHSKLHVVMTDAQTGVKYVVSDHNMFKRIFEELRASAALPILYDRRIMINHKYYIDGSVADALPLDVALKLGCTDIVIILNQQLSAYRFDGQHERLRRHLIKVFAKNQPDAIKKILPSDEKLLKVNIRWLRRPHKKVRIYLLEPSNEEMMISLASIDKKKVGDLAKLGVTDMDLFLNKEIVQKHR